jgi:hypothetical protein
MNKKMDFLDKIKNDCIAVQELFKQRGFDISIEQAEEIWSTYSSRVYFASWMPVGVSDFQFEEELLPIAKEILGIQDEAK